MCRSYGLPPVKSEGFMHGHRKTIKNYGAAKEKDLIFIIITIIVIIITIIIIHFYLLLLLLLLLILLLLLLLLLLLYIYMYIYIAKKQTTHQPIQSVCFARLGVA